MGCIATLRQPRLPTRNGSAQPSTLYGWKVAQELRLAPPPTLAAERQLWSDLSRFLYRGVAPDPDRVRYSHPKNET